MILKEDLDNQYQIWQEQINNMEVTLENVTSAFAQKSILRIRIKKHRRNLETVKLTTGNKKVKQELTLFIKELHHFQVQLNENYQKFFNFVNYIIHIDDDNLRGLTPKRIQQFKQFTSNESFVRDQCVICQEDIEIGRNMMRLDCDGQHTFCQVCI